MDWLRSQRPDLVERYEELYRRGAYAPHGERERLAGLVRRPGVGGAGGRWKGLPSAPERPSEPRASQERLF
jgi:hypothetical protein